MSDQRLISKQDYDNFFAPSWIAGTMGINMLKTKEHDIYAVNVPVTCDKLRRLVTTPPQSRNEHKRTALAQRASLDFRTASNLCYGTLRIYQLQVDRLLNMSRDLCARSNCELYIVASVAKKRKSSGWAVPCAPAKKRRFVKTATQNKTTVKQFSQIINESEGLVKWSTFAADSEIELSATQPITQKCLQIREITIRETNVDIMLSLNANENDYADFGFGYDPQNEMANEVHHYFADKFSESNVIRQTLKRKTSIEHNFNNNELPRICADTTIELPRCASISLNESATQLHCIDSNLSDRQIQQNRECDFEDNSIAAQTNEIETDINPAALILQLTPGNYLDYDHNMSNIDEPLIVNMETPPQPLLDQIKRKSKLSIDNCIILDTNKLIKQIENYANLQINTKNHCRQRKTLVNAHELFNSLNRNHILKVNLKRKHTISPEDAELQYLNIVRELNAELSNVDINDLANEIYPKWQQSNIATNGNKRKRLSATEVIETEPQLLNNLNGNLDFSACNNLNGNNNSTCDSSDKKQCNETDDDTKCRPLGVMMRLLDIWRCSVSNDNDGGCGIDAKRFCLSVGKRRHAALAFGSLLDLVARRFIEISKAPNSIEMHQIELGTESAKLIRNVDMESRKL